MINALTSLTLRELFLEDDIINIVDVMDYDRHPSNIYLPPPPLISCIFGSATAHATSPSLNY